MIHLPGTIQVAWQRNRAFFRLLLGMLLVFSVLKILFYQYNHSLLNTGGGKVLQLVAWSLLYDFLIVLLINIPFLIALTLTRPLSAAVCRWVWVPLFAVLNIVAALFNLLDIFYFRFHFQRATADLLHVIDHPFGQLLHFGWGIIIIFFLSVTALSVFIYILCQKVYRDMEKGNKATLSFILSMAVFLILLINPQSIGRKLVPTYPLVNINSRQLLLVENSFHTFCYSLIREGQEVPLKQYMSESEANATFPLVKKSMPLYADSNRKNVVLFIMESIPYEFFDSSSQYKVAMPFFDSLLRKSTFYNHAFAYSHQSNKGITAILAGIPTLTDIPVYHTQFVNMPVTPLGSALSGRGYQSFFCIGDQHDNFGFAKCANWMGIQQYYSREDIPGYRQLPANPMGIQDEYVLDFVRQKIDATAQPFLAVHYNTSTHYPYELPEKFSRRFPAGYSSPMKSMAYYDYSLQQFFSQAKNSAWFNNTIFIFCPDHWLAPDDRNIVFNNISGYHIPVIIHDPSRPVQQTDSRTSSQFDIAATILSIAGYPGNIISYGNSLLQPSPNNPVSFSRISNTLYQVNDSAYCLSFNTATDKTEYLYHYSTDKTLQHDLSNDAVYAEKKRQLENIVKAFIQQASQQYHRISTP